ncbi:FAD-binding oxidoreductase [candidate division KSB1 bacterium]|nr:FAD-binding oxidoreductase [candidate division KSB1 bacterium]
MNREFDVIIIGGGIIGLATAYYLAKQHQSVLVLEKSYIGSGSTGRCISGIRAQFSTETSIKLAMHSIELFQGMDREFGHSVEWSPTGYLFLAHDEERKEGFLKVMQIQQQQGLDVRFYERNEIEKIFPYVNTQDLIGGTYCPTDGQADPFLVLKGYFRGIKKNNGQIRTHTEVIAVEATSSDSYQVICSNNDIYSAKKILNAAGPFAKEVGAMIGLDLPVEPERHEAAITEPIEFMKVPMVVDYRKDGCYFVQRLTGQFIGCYTPDEKIPGHSLNSTFEFMTEMPRRMMRLMPMLKDISIIRQWSGSYSMTPDGNPIIGETKIPGFYICVGMCGHGFMFGPALGEFMAHHILTGTWPINMDEFACNRNFIKGKEALK